MKEAFQHAVAALVVTGVGWLCYTLVAVDKRTAVIEIKVEKNSELLHSMINKEARLHGNKSRPDGKTDQQAANEEEVPLRKAAWPSEPSFTELR